jgi:hypothetical protein
MVAVLGQEGFSREGRLMGRQNNTSKSGTFYFPFTARQIVSSDR